MAYVKVSTSRVATRALRYGEHEPDAVRAGVNLPDGTDTETAARLMAADRAVWGKRTGVQAHIVIQSFADADDLTPEQANAIGVETARAIAPGHRAMVYTHRLGRGRKLHNHIVIGSINPLDGNKLDGHGMLYLARQKSDEVCLAHGLTMMQDVAPAQNKYTQAEDGLLRRGKSSWVDGVRQAVIAAMETSTTLDEYKAALAKSGVSISIRVRKRDGHSSITYHTASGARIRGSKLGDNYDHDNVMAGLRYNLELARHDQGAGRPHAAGVRVYRSAGELMRGTGMTADKIAACLASRVSYARHALGGKALSGKERGRLKLAVAKAIKDGKLDKYGFDVHERTGGASGGGGRLPDVRLHDNDRVRDVVGAGAAAVGHNDDRQELMREWRLLSDCMRAELEMDEFLRSI